jgi:hypothetical protein
MGEGGWKRPARLPDSQCVWTGLEQGSKSSKDLSPGIASISQSLMCSRTYPSFLMDALSVEEVVNGNPSPPSSIDCASTALASWANNSYNCKPL